MSRPALWVQQTVFGWEVQSEPLVGESDPHTWAGPFTSKEAADAWAAGYEQGVEAGQEAVLSQ